MKLQPYRNQWLEYLRQGNFTELENLPKQIALSFLDHHYYNDQYRTDYIDLLCEIALSSEQSSLRRAASSALFGIIVEGLCDVFEESNTNVYNRVLSQVVTYYRQTEQGQQIDRKLRTFGLHTFDDFFQRIEKIRASSDKPKYDKLDYPEKILILSRVTLGADVAITSVIIQYMQNLFPESEIVIIGGPKLHDLFGGNSRVRIKQVDYSRRGALAERLESWHNLREAVESESSHLPAEKIMVFDPDSRLSQLGLFPVVRNSPYLFFDSRGKATHPRNLSMAELANHWLNNVFARTQHYYPQVWLKDAVSQNSRNAVDLLRESGAERIISINFGVGGNERKRLSDAAEKKLIRSLLDTPRTVVILDKGAGAEEQKRIESVVEAAKSNGEQFYYCEFKNLKQSCTMRHGILCVSAGIGEMAALISCSDEYIGYDSACQHIAAAFGVPTCTVFAGTNDPDFVRRWRATGTGMTRIVHVDTLTAPAMFTDDDIVARVIHARNEEYRQ